MTTIYKLVSKDTDETKSDMQNGANELMLDDVTDSDAHESDVAGSSDKTASGLSFHPESFLKSTVYMGRGMLGIFVAILIIVLITMLLNRIKTKNK